MDFVGVVAACASISCCDKLDDKLTDYRLGLDVVVARLKLRECAKRTMQVEVACAQFLD